MKITAIYGPNGSGKSRYVEELRRRLPADSVRYMAFRDSYGVGVDQAYYLQLRWNQHDIDGETPTVRELLQKSMAPGSAVRGEMTRLFGLDSMMDRLIISLSSGELRKLQLARTLLAKPRTLIIDNPFIGLDAEMREQLRDFLPQLDGIVEELYLVVARRKDIPDYVTDIIVMPVEKLTKEVIAFRNVTIRYGERTILKDLNWTVNEGEHWALSGQNGAGKSTLLSLVCGDNPQRYACDIALFGQRQGEPGRSIWDLKRRIGYVSPELHRSYHRDLPALSVVASGLKDTVGLYVRTSAEERQQCLFWMQLFGVAQLADRSFLRLSSGEQRLLLVVRAFVKDPDLLVLDEPLHGLDDRNRELVKRVVEWYCQRPGKTLVYVSHYHEEWPQCIDHELFLKRQE
jgi:molybdate transport system ATP-binding protein